MTIDEKPGSSILDTTNEAPSLPARLEPLAEAARDYARAATSTNTNRAYAADWRHYSAWARRQNLPALPPNPQVIGLYIAACASGAASGGKSKNSVGTIERRLSALAWNFAQLGESFDRKDRHVATVLAGIRRIQGRPPEQKEAVLPEDLLDMIATLDLGVAELLLHIALVDLGRGGEAGAQRMAREFLLPFTLAEVTAHAGRQRGMFDQSGDVPVGQAIGADFSANHPPEQRPDRNPGKFEPGFQGDHRAGGVRRDLRGLRDRAILLVGFAGGLRRSEIVGLDCRAEDGLTGGWIEFFDDGLLLTLRGKTGWREVEIGRGSPPPK